MTVEQKIDRALERLQSEISMLGKSWQNQLEDPYSISTGVMTSLFEIHNAILRTRRALLTRPKPVRK